MLAVSFKEEKNMRKEEVDREESSQDQDEAPSQKCKIQKDRAGHIPSRSTFRDINRVD